MAEHQNQLSKGALTKLCRRQGWIQQVS